MLTPDQVIRAAHRAGQLERERLARLRSRVVATRGPTKTRPRGYRIVIRPAARLAPAVDTSRWARYAITRMAVERAYRCGLMGD